jgi:rod shape determining protein RodA
MIARLVAEFGRRMDWLLIVGTLGLSGIGLVTIYSVDLSRGSTLSFFSTQAISLIIGIVVMFFAATIHATRYENGARLIFLLTLILLVSVLFLGTSIRGTRGWFHLGGLSFQPVELGKVALLIFLAWRIERSGRQFNQLSFLWGTAIMAGLLIVPVLLQPDLGSALVMTSIWLGLIVLSGIRKRYIVGLVVAGLILFVSAWFFLFKDYQKERLLTFIEPTRDPLGAGYNVNQSMIAIGSGQLFGRGLGFGSQSQLHFLPEAQTDFIISVIGEELGFVGLSLILIGYALILLRLIAIARRARADFGAYAAAGIAILFAVQLTVNMGAAFGILPVTGVTLPFVSYGGSSLISNYLLIGLALSLNRQARLS